MEWIIVILIASMTGYQAGKAGAKVEVAEKGGYCRQDENWDTQCYKVQKSEDRALNRRLGD